MKFILLALLIFFALGCGSEAVDSDLADGGPGNSELSDGGAGSDLAIADMGGGGAPDMGGSTEDSGTVGSDVGTTADVGELPPVDTSPLDVMDRPAQVVVPDNYDRRQAYPLIVLLHGYGAYADFQDSYLGVGERSTERGFVLVKPNGTRNPEMKRFWNASEWCCDRYAQNIDDVAYISGLLDAAKARFNIDPARVYFIGHSNGGFMSYRMACEVEGITAIASLAGSSWLDESDCAGSASPVSVLQIHGTADGTVFYNGSPTQYPSAPDLVRRWAGRNGCDAEPTAGASLDLERTLLGDETTTELWDGCDGGTSVGLWTIELGGHIPIFQPAFIESTLDFLLSKTSP